MTDDLDRRIRERAYEIWENEGQPEGRSHEHWEQARREFQEAQQENAAENISSTGASGATGKAKAGTRGRRQADGAVSTGSGTTRPSDGKTSPAVA